MKNAAAKMVLLAATLVGVALATTACGPVVPVAPTWKDDVRPLLVARCIRCHDSPGRADPSTNPAIAPPEAAYNFNYVDLPSPLPPGLMALKDQGVKSVKGELKPLRRMPPPPAEALEDWQIDILDGWAVNPQ